MEAENDRQVSQEQSMNEEENSQSNNEEDIFANNHDLIGV
eukprot:CAMPEP_0116886014 /NCGR_PEP_ID=MMETSP0463-20121206/19670_1 /TAXON_ID=181622 /ORGANISM="Strombidinopsis sp, Strain SopsisLIS2011" /LENGTH=39 /DNA_ID= /DNA_START= /DNA_END= /DNA_ORIENTATION=